MPLHGAGRRRSTTSKAARRTGQASQKRLSVIVSEWPPPQLRSSLEGARPEKWEARGKVLRVTRRGISSIATANRASKRVCRRIHHSWTRIDRRRHPERSWPRAFFNSARPTAEAIWNVSNLNDSESAKRLLLLSLVAVVSHLTYPLPCQEKQDVHCRRFAHCRRSGRKLPHRAPHDPGGLHARGPEPGAAPDCRHRRPVCP